MSTKPKRSRNRADDVASKWMPLIAFMHSENVTADDLVRMQNLGLMPLTQAVHAIVWVHRPTIPDWRLLLELNGFKTQHEILVEAQRAKAKAAVTMEAAHAD
jgi:hypothetical protein